MVQHQGEVLLPPPSQFGFCEGVVSADDLLSSVSDIARMQGIEVVYGYHDIVHNQQVREKHENNGVIFVDELDLIPDASVVVTSAHGVSPEVTFALRNKGCEHFDAACPLVVSTHRAIQTARANAEKVIYIGHGKPGDGTKLHDEIVGALGHMDYFLKDEGDALSLVGDPIDRSFVELGEDLANVRDLLSEEGRYRMVTQTTLNDRECLAFQQVIAEFIENLQPAARIAKVQRSDVCRAVRQRQGGVVTLLANPTLRRLVVVTDLNSSNGMGYYTQALEIVEEAGLDTEVLHIAIAEEASQIAKDGLTAITASASTPDDTTIEVARMFGADEAQLSWQREKFRLKDDNPEVISARIGELIRRRLAN